ncbi:MAG: type II secretion system protein [Cloacibacillus sp.]
MPKGCARGFTLIEIMLVVGLIGIIASAALAPIVFTVRSMEEAQKSWGARHNAAAAVDRIFSDARRIIPNSSFSVFKIIHKSGFGSAGDDRLVLWSAAPKYEGKNVGVVVYRVVQKDAFNNAAPGLYRWVLVNVPSQVTASGDAVLAGGEKPKTPMDVETDKLDPKEGRLLLADVQGINFYVRNEDKWVQECDGDIPKMLKIEVAAKDGLYTRIERFPNARAK